MMKSIRKRLAKDLPLSVLKQLSMHLNPRMVCGGDWMSLAGEFEMTYMEIRNYERAADPTMAVLEKWWIDVGDKTVSRLIEILRKIKRADVVKILEPYEFYGMSFDIHGMNIYVVVIHKDPFISRARRNSSVQLCEFSSLACSKGK